MEQSRSDHTVRDQKGERWHQEGFEKVEGVPWEAIPGRGQIEIKSKVRIEVDRSAEGVPNPQVKESEVRRICIKISDLTTEKYGITLGRKGCMVALPALLAYTGGTSPPAVRNDCR